MLMPSRTSSPTRRLRPGHHLLFVAGLVTLIGGSADGQAVDRSDYVVRKGTDTALVEHISRTPTQLRSTMVSRERGTAFLVAGIAPGELVSSLELRRGDSTSAPLGTLTFGTDSVVMKLKDFNERRMAGRAGIMPHIEWSVASAEQLLRRARSVGTPIVDIPILLMSADIAHVRVALESAGVYRITYPEYELVVRVDSGGRLMGGCVASDEYIIERIGVPSVACN